MNDLKMFMLAEYVFLKKSVTIYMIWKDDQNRFKYLDIYDSVTVDNKFELLQLTKC